MFVTVRICRLLLKNETERGVVLCVDSSATEGSGSSIAVLFDHRTVWCSKCSQKNEVQLAELLVALGEAWYIFMC